MKHNLVAGALTAWLAVLSTQAFAASTPLVNHGDIWRYHKGTNAPVSTWKTLPDGSLDATWASGAGGFGYASNTDELALVQTQLTDMMNRYTTIYIRRSFNVASAVDTNQHLLLTMDWDDGFIAWLDGVHLTNYFAPNAPNEPANTNRATSGHESSRGNSSPQPAVTFDLGPVGSRLTLGTHILALIGLNDSTNSSDCILIADLAIGDPPSPPVGTITTNTTWTQANSPYVLLNNVTVASGATLTIEPGTSVYLGSGVNLIVAAGGRLIAEGNETNRIVFTRNTGSISWGGMTINGIAGSPETRIGYAHFEFNGSTAIHSAGGTVFLSHLTFGTTSEQYLSLDSSSFVVSDCLFPSATALFENVHGNGGIKAGGRGIFIHNFFGLANSVSGNYNDVLDFTGGNRPGPIIQFINNVFVGSDDDLIDLDGTDAWIEGNIFLHVHRNGSPDSASAISGGNDSSRTSEITIIGNLFYDCDQAATAKQGNFYTLINNTIVRQTIAGGVDTDGAVVNFADEGTSEAAGMYLEGNIIYDAEKLVRNLTSAAVTFTNNLMPFAWAGPGGGNSTNNPRLKHIPQLSETVFTNWQQAQVMRDWFSLQTNSPALGAGPNGRDQGGVIPLGVSISGEPSNVTTQNIATLRVGHGVPAAGWPEGSGYTHYKWRLDTNAWSGEVPISTPIALSALSAGAHYVEVAGKRDSLFYQDDPVFGADALVTRSRTWMVQTEAVLRITSASRAGTEFTLHFIAEAGRTYTVQFRDSLTTGTWMKLIDVSAQPSTGDYSATDSGATGESRFYRIVTPAQ